MSTFNDRKTTHFWVDSETSPNLEKRDIIVRYDADSEKRHVTPDEVAQQAGMMPLIRVGDYRVSGTDIASVNLTIGESFLPVISITFKDQYTRFQKNVTSRQELLDFFYGSTRDAYFIKQQYRVLNTYISPSSPYVTVDAKMWVPEFYKKHIRSFDDKTSYEVIKELCKECKIGLWTNIRETNDRQKWIQDNCTNLEFIQRVISKAFISDETRIISFIDQYDYLNLIDINSALNNRSIEKVSVNPYTHEDMTETDVILSNKRAGQDNKKPNDEKNENIFPIQRWANSFTYGQNEEVIPEKIERNTWSIDKRKIEIEQTTLESNTKLIPTTSYISTKWSNVHDNYDSVEKERGTKILHFSQGDTLEVEMRYPCYFLYPWMYVPVRMFYSKIKGEHDDQTSESTAEEMYDKTAKMKFPDENDTLEYENILHSGDYIIESITYTFEDPDTDASVDSFCKQILKLHRQPLNNPPKQLLL